MVIEREGQPAPRGNEPNAYAPTSAPQPSLICAVHGAPYQHHCERCHTQAYALRGDITKPLFVAALVAGLGIALGSVAGEENPYRDAAIRAGASEFEIEMSGSVWRGETSSHGKTYPFILRFAPFADGKLSGEMDWGPVVLEVRGTYKGERLRFVDTRILRGYVGAHVGDWKDVVIDGSAMTGTDKGGASVLIAEKVR